MADSETLTQKLTLSKLSEASAFVIGGTYLLGVFVVLRHLSTFGVSSVSLFRLQYIIAGTWALLPMMAILAILQAYNVKLEMTKPLTKNALSNIRRAAVRAAAVSFFTEFLAIAVVFLLVLAFFWFGLSADFESAMNAIVDRRALILLGFALLIGWAWWAAKECLRRAASWQQESDSRRARLYRVFSLYCLTLCLIFGCLYILYFTKEIYPRIPYSLGGGEALQVSFLFREGSKPPYLLADMTGSRSVPYKLLVATENAFVVQSPNKDELSLEIRREAVEGMVVLAKEEKK